MAEAMSQITVTVAPSVPVILEALEELGNALRQTGADDVVIGAWMQCTERVIRGFQVVTVYPTESLLN